MTHPLANPKSSERDALNELAEHYGFQLLQRRLQSELTLAIAELREAVGIQAIGRYQGVCATIEYVAGLRERMIAELELEISNASKPTPQSIYEAFYGTKQ